jgi:ATP-binding cassette subfamily B protein/ATP-binding cassette subfamily C protein LapB
MAASCGANRLAAMALRRASDTLVRHVDDWASRARRMRHVGFSARHLAARLDQVLDLPGDFLLIQGISNGFLLLHRSHDRWWVVDQTGQATIAFVSPKDEVFVEAVAFRNRSFWATPAGFSSLAALWPLLRAAWAEVGVASLFVNSGQLLLPLFSMLIYDKVVNNGVFETLWALVIGMLIYLAADVGMRLVRAWAVERIGDELTCRSDESLWSRLSAQVDAPAGGMARFLTHYRDVMLSRDFVSSAYLLGIADIPFLLLYLLVIGIIAWPLLVVALTLAGGYALAGMLLQRQANRLAREAEQVTTRKLAFMGEALWAFDVIRTVPGAGAFLRRWRDLSERSVSSEGQRRLAANRLNVLSAGMLTISTVAMLAAGVYLVEARLLSVGGLIASNLLSSRVMGLVASLFMVIGKWDDFMRATKRMESSLEVVPEKSCVPRADTAGNIRVIGLRKCYEGRPPALDNVSLVAAAGERIALLGRPGAGKTTLLRCLAGLCKPDSGQLLIDGLALDDIARVDRARWLAWKSQDPALFAGTLEDNLGIAIGRGHEARLAQAIWASGLEEELSSGRMTLGMLLAERGSNLSGGQRQKVALARAFAQPSRIMLLDEPTLGLDPDSEKQLAERLPQLLGKDSLLMMTTHSVIMLGLTERVVAMDGGRIIADGPRAKLVQIA